MERMRFSQEDRRMVHQRAGNSCEFPGAPCPRPNNRIVHHLTGVHEAIVERRDPEPIGDASLNALMLCTPHALEHDVQEQAHIAQFGDIYVSRTNNRRYQARTNALNRRRYSKRRRR